jgi:uncharacterized protein
LFPNLCLWQWSLRRRGCFSGWFTFQWIRPDNRVVDFRFAVRVKPGARKDRVGGCWGENALIVAVAAPAVEGKANEQLRVVLAKAFGVRKADVSLVAGDRGRDKIVELSPAPADAAERLNTLLAKST